jgi:SAM-dependent methyltransferase
VRRYPEKHPYLTIVQGNFLSNRLPDAAFDLVVMVSTIEHFGFGSYGDPLIEDGDKIAMQQIYRVLKKQGRVILTVPFAARHRICNGFERWYDMDRLAQLLDDLHIVVSEFWVPALWIRGRCLKWKLATLEQAKHRDQVRKILGHMLTER